MYYNIKGYDINVILLEDANGVPGSVWHNDDGSFSVFIDSKLSFERQQEVFKHELRHIFGNDFEKYDVQMIEYNAHEPVALSGTHHLLFSGTPLYRCN